MRGSREREGSRCIVRGREGEQVTLGAEAKGRKRSLFGGRRKSHLEESRADGRRSRVSL